MAENEGFSGTCGVFVNAIASTWLNIYVQTGSSAHAITKAVAAAWKERKADLPLDDSTKQGFEEQFEYVPIVRAYFHGPKQGTGTSAR